MASPLAGANLTELLLYYSYLERFRDVPPDFNLTVFTDPVDNTHDIGTAVAVVAYLMTAIASIVVVLRLYMRRTRGLQTWGWDDWLIIPALIATIGFTAVQGLVTSDGCVGRHVYDTSLASIKSSYVYEYAGTVVYLLASLLIKISILCFINRLSQTIRTRSLVVLTQLIVFASFVGCILTLSFSCSPIRAVYDLETAIQPSTQCIAIWEPLLAWSILFALTDIWLIILPICIVWHLNLPRQARLGILFVFACGFIATAAAIVKASMIRRAYNSVDACYQFVAVLIASHLELTFGLIVASLPALNHLILRHVSSTIKRSTDWAGSPRDGLSPRQGVFVMDYNDRRHLQRQEQRGVWEIEMDEFGAEPTLAQKIHSPSFFYPQKSPFADAGIGVALSSPPMALQRDMLPNRYNSTSFPFSASGEEETYLRARALSRGRGYEGIDPVSREGREGAGPSHWQTLRDGTRIRDLEEMKRDLERRGKEVDMDMDSNGDDTIDGSRTERGTVRAYHNRVNSQEDITATTSTTEETADDDFTISDYLEGHSRDQESPEMFFNRPVLSFADSEYSVELVLQRPPNRRDTIEESDET